MTKVTQAKRTSAVKPREDQRKVDPSNIITMKRLSPYSPKGENYGLLWKFPEASLGTNKKSTIAFVADYRMCD